MMITVKAMIIWWLYKEVEREIRLLDIVTYFFYFLSYVMMMIVMVLRIHLHRCMYVGTFAHLFHLAPIEFTQCSYSILYICIVEFSIIIITFYRDIIILTIFILFYFHVLTLHYYYSMDILLSTSPVGMVNWRLYVL